MGGLSDQLTIDLKSKLNPTPEFFIIDEGWFRFDNGSAADMPADIDYYYPAAHLIPYGEHAGKVFYTTTRLVPDSIEPPEPTYHDGYTQIFDPNGDGSEDPFWIQFGGQRTQPSQYSNHLLLPLRLNSSSMKVVVIGGEWASILDTVDIIDLDDTTPSWTTIDPMTIARKDHNSIILPDRNILVVGGYNNSGPVNTPEMLDSDNLTWSTLTAPEMDIPRMYHSTALLLPNGKVLLGGGRVMDGGDVEDDTERRLTVFEPGYLADGTQHEIISAPTEVNYGDPFLIEVDGDYRIDSMCFMRPMSVTHGYGSEQRYIELAFEQYIEPFPSNKYTVTAPTDSNIAPPGYYMLFVVKDVSESISGNSKMPSIAKFIKLSL